MSDKKYILDRETAAKKMQRMALEVAESLDGDSAPLVLIGVRNSGMVIAEKIAAMLKPFISNAVKVIAVNMDKHHPVEVTLSENMVFDQQHILICDDVTNSGSTLLYALKPLLAFHPKSIRTLVLVERMHKRFPVSPDFKGLSVATTLQNHIQVEVENGEVTGAFIA
jgi:pyrimidine operon attenuation protein/uracil phosphoribosyltransferase